MQETTDAPVPGPGRPATHGAAYPKDKNLERILI